jgi:RNA polymerase sigma-70 factor (ECF subfamily)
MLFGRNENDARIVRRVLAGRREEFGDLIRRYEPTVRSIALAHISAQVDVLDVVQETFIAAYTRLDTLRDEKQFAPWVASIARNTAVSHVRKEHRLQTLHESCPTGQEGSRVDDAREDLYEILHTELEVLESTHREVLLLYYFAHMPTRQVADTLDLTVEAVKKRLQRARTQLGERLIARLSEKTENRDAREQRLARLTQAVIAVPVVWNVPASFSLLALVKSAWEIPMFKVAAASAAIAAFGISTWFAVPAVRSRSADRDIPAIEKTLTSSITTATRVDDGTRRVATLDETRKGPDTPIRPAEVTTPNAFYVSDDDGPTAFEPGICAITGRVEFQDGGPVPNATVEATRRQWDTYKLPNHDRLTIRSFTDSDGRFAFFDLPMDTYILRAHTEAQGAIRTCSLREDRPKMDVAMTLEDTGSISGQVVDEAGRPLAGALVVPYYTEHEKREWRLDIRTLHGTLTEADGRFTIDKIWAEGDWSVMAQAPGYGSVVSARVPAGTTNLRVQLAPGGVWHGLVLDDDSGNSVPNLKLTVMSSNPVREKFDVFTDNGGRFSVEGLRDDEEYVVAPELPDGLLLTIPVSIQLPEPAGVIEDTVHVYRGAGISGQVTLANSGTPVPEAILAISTVDEAALDGQVEVNRVAQVEADSRGMYSFTGLPAGQYTVSALQAEYGGIGSGVIYATGISITRSTRPLMHDDVPVSTTLTLERGEQRSAVNFAVDREFVARITGWVVDPSGRPVPLANVATSPVGGGFVHRTHTDQAGAFVVQHPGLATDVHIQAWSEEMVSPVMGPYTLSVEDIEGLTVTLKTACGFLEGRIVDEAGNPVYAVGITPRLQDFSLQQPETEISNQIGRFEFRGLLPGTYVIDLGPARIVDGHHHPHQPNTATVEIPDCEPVRGIELVLHGTGEPGPVDVSDF